MPKKATEPDETFVFGTELRDAIATSVMRVLPNVKAKEIVRMVSEIEVELDNWYAMEQDGK